MNMINLLLYVLVALATLFLRNILFLKENQLFEDLNITMYLLRTCLVFILPKFLIYMSYSLTGGKSSNEKLTEKSRSINGRSSELLFLQDELKGKNTRKVKAKYLLFLKKDKLILYLTILESVGIEVVLKLISR